MDSFVSEYFEVWPEFVSGLKEMELKHGLSLLSRAKSERNEINFFAWLTEMRFGLFLNNFCENLCHERNVDGKTPDWSFTLNGQNVLLEVARINVSDSEMMEELERQKEMRRFQKNNPGLPFIYRGAAKVLDSSFFYGAQSKLQAKETKYRGVIEKHGLPFIVGIGPMLLTYINADDAFDFLIGSSKKGFLYTDEYFRKNVSGVLLNTSFGEWIYFGNPNAHYPLNESNREKFMPYAYLTE